MNDEQKIKMLEASLELAIDEIKNNSITIKQLFAILKGVTEQKKYCEQHRDEAVLAWKNGEAFQPMAVEHWKKQVAQIQVASLPTTAGEVEAIVRRAVIELGRTSP